MATRKFTLFELHVDDIRAGSFSLGGTDHGETDDSDEAIDPSAIGSEEPSRRWLVPFVGLAGLVFGAGAIAYRRMRPDSDVVDPEVEVAVEGDEAVTDEIRAD